MTEAIDFSACERLPGRAYNGVDFVRRNADGVLAPSLARIVPRIDMAAICEFIDDTPLLNDLQRRFYKTYLAARLEVLFGKR